MYVAGYPFRRKISAGVKVTKAIVSCLTGIGDNFSQIQIEKMITGETYHLSCWMTMAQIEKGKSRKVIFQDLD